MFETIFENDDFIASWLASELSEENLTAFCEWLEEHPERKPYFTDMKRLWDESALLKIEPSVASGKMWKNISASIGVPSRTELLNRKNPHKQYIWIAAAASLLLFIGSYFWFNRQSVIIHTTAYAEHKEIILPDGSRVHLNAGSSLRYYSKGWNEHRQVWFDGEAFFEIEKNALPFTVHCDTVNAEVLGTSFNIRERNEFIDIACITGRIQVYSDVFRDSMVELTPGIATRVRSLQPPGKSYHFTGNPSGWTSGQFFFYQGPVYLVVQELQRQFNVPIIIKTKKSDITFTGMIPMADRKTALDVLCLAAGWQIKINPDSSVVLY